MLLLNARNFVDISSLYEAKIPFQQLPMPLLQDDEASERLELGRLFALIEYNISDQLSSDKWKEVKQLGED